MRSILIALSFAAVTLMAQGQSPSLTSTPRASHVIKIEADTAQTPAAEIRQVDVADASGHRGAVVVIYESTSGLYWWTWRATSPNDTSDVVQPFLDKLRIRM